MDAQVSLETMLNNRLSYAFLSELGIEQTHRWLLLTLNETETVQNVGELHQLNQTEWIALTKEAIRLRLTHGLYRFLLRNPELTGEGPEFARARLKQSRQATLRHNLKQAAQFLRVKKALDHEGIECLLMKGLWINAVLYQDQAARRSGDIDLLFRPQDMPRATRVFQQLKLSPLNDLITDVRDLAPNNHEFTLREPVSSIYFDIHWGMTHPLHESPVDEAAFWDRSQSYPIAGIECRSFKLEDHLLLLSFHAAEHHRFQGVGLRALIDIAQILAWPPGRIDWDDLLRRARLIGWDKGLALLLALINDITGMTPPVFVTRSLTHRHPVTPEIKRHALEAMILEQDRKDNIGNRVLNLTQAPSRAAQLRHIVERLFTPPRRMLEYARMTPEQIRRRPWQWPVLYLQRWKVLVSDVPQFLDLCRGNDARRAELRRSARLRQWLRGDG